MHYIEYQNISAILRSDYLDIGESRQFWSYEESCLEHIY